MSRMKLKNIAVEKNERVDNPSSSPYSVFVGLEHYDSGEATIRRYGSTERLESTMKVFHAGDILIARRNVYLKRAATVDFDGLTSGDSIVLHIENEAYRRIIPFVLNTDDFWDYANQHADGSMSKRLSPKLLMEYEFSLPDESINQVSDILWAMERVKNAYRELIARTDDLVKSQFIEVLKPYEEARKVITIEEMVRPDRPVTYGIVKPGTNVEGGVPVVRVKDFTDGIVHTDDLLHTKPELNAKYLRSTLLEGDILLSIGGTIGRVAIVPKELVGANITQHTARISLREEYDPLYVKGVLESPIMQDVMARNKLGVAQVGLNLRDIRKFPVPDVPKEMQERLSAIYEQSDKSKFAAQQALKELTDAQKALMKRIFE